MSKTSLIRATVMTTTSLSETIPKSTTRPQGSAWWLLSWFVPPPPFLLLFIFSLPFVSLILFLLIKKKKKRKKCFLSCVCVCVWPQGSKHGGQLFGPTGFLGAPAGRVGGGLAVACAVWYKTIVYFPFLEFNSIFPSSAPELRITEIVWYQPAKNISAFRCFIARAVVV